jgi:hypothetical protein
MSTTFPSFLTVRFNVRSSTLAYDRVSEIGSPLIFPVKVASPLLVHGFTVCVDALPSHFYFSDRAFETHGVELQRSGAIFDLASFSFQIPICGSEAKQTAPAKKQNVRVNPIVLFSCAPSNPDFPFRSIFFQADRRQ